MGQASDLIQKVSLGARTLESSIIQGVGSASEFIRKNPVTSAVSVGGGLLAGITAIQIVRKARKKSAKVKKRKPRARTARRAPRRKVSKKKRKITHRTPRHKGHKRVSFTTASGQKVNFLVKKKVRKHKHRRHHK